MPRFPLVPLCAVALACLFLFACGGKDQTDAPAKKTAPGESVSPAVCPGPLAPGDPEAVALESLTRLLGQVPQPAKPRRICAALPDSGPEASRLMVRGVQARAKELSLVLEPWPPQAGTPACEAVIVCPGSQPDAARLAGSGAPVIALGSDVSAACAARVGPDQVEMGSRAADFFCAKLQKGASLAVIAAAPATESQTRRLQGFAQTAKAAGLKIAASIEAPADPAKAKAGIATLLAANPGVSGLYCQSDVLALAAAEAIKDEQRPHKPLVVGAGGDSETYDAIRQGDLAASGDGFPYIQGRSAVDLALRLLAGQAVPSSISSPQALVSLATIDAPLPGGKDRESRGQRP